VLLLNCLLFKSLRKIVFKLTPNSIRSLTSEFISTLELCSDCAELGVVWEIHGNIGLGVTLFLLCIWFADVFEDAEACPCGPVEDCLLKGQSFTSKHIFQKLLGQLLAAIVTDKYTKCIWCWHLMAQHSHLHVSRCEAALQVPILYGMAIEGFITFVSRLIALESSNWSQKVAVYANSRPTMSSSHGRSNGQPLSLPPRWLKCPRKGDLIADKFIPFKTPLDDKYKSQIPATDLFTPRMLISLISNYKVKLGLWIDLTFTGRFYDKALVEQTDVNYCKFQCKGHDECPTEEQTQLFVNCCYNYIAKNPLHVIGVHCTHGFNRTGFLISAFLIEKHDWSVEAAVSAFARARPPGIYKESYLRELFRRYGDVEDTPPAPPLPDWCSESDDTDDDGNAINKHNNNNNANNSQSNNYKNQRKTFMEGVEGVTILADMNIARAIQQTCQHLCHFKRGGFPGSQPVSMDMHNLGLLSTREYMVSWKADGTRYMLYIKDEKESYFIDRDNTLFKISGVKFFKRKEFPNHLVNTLLDGEMIVDEVKGQKIARYLIYDIISFEGQEVGGTDFRRRMLCIEKEVIGPRERAKVEGVIDRTKEPFGVRKKDFWELRDTYKIFEEKFTRNLSHEIDGLIFQPVPDSYIPGQCDLTLKWKPPSLNSVDFRLKIILDDRPGMLRKLMGNLYVGGLDLPFATMKVTKDLKQYDNKIVECNFDVAIQQWVFMRERTDKSFPNSHRTATSVCQSMLRPITKEVLFDYIDRNAVRGSKRDFNDHSGNSGNSAERTLMPPPMKAPRK
ncbi:unnamed protein product, partial [Medioppia subpectinata]